MKPSLRHSKNIVEFTTKGLTPPTHPGYYGWGGEYTLCKNYLLTSPIHWSGKFHYFSPTPLVSIFSCTNWVVGCQWKKGFVFYCLLDDSNNIWVQKNCAWRNCLVNKTFWVNKIFWINKICIQKYFGSNNYFWVKRNLWINKWSPCTRLN